jgi:hypothetical protein
VNFDEVVEHQGLGKAISFIPCREFVNCRGVLCKHGVFSVLRPLYERSAAFKAENQRVLLGDEPLTGVALCSATR